MIHGGGWRSGSRTNQARQCAFLAERGLVAVTADYRLATGIPGTTWPAQLNDVQLAMRWVRAHAAEYHIDPARICAEGESAGGHLALMLGVVTGIAPGDMQAVLPGISPHADCVISLAGPSDLVKLAAFRPPLIANLLGQQDTARMQDEAAGASPALLAHPGATVPTLLVHGLADPVVPLAQATEMQSALLKAGTRTWLLTHQGGHVLNGITPQERTAIFSLIASFVRLHTLPGPPRQMTVEEALDEAH
jgi:acetyl esterase/lipase